MDKAFSQMKHIRKTKTAIKLLIKEVLLLLLVYPNLSITIEALTTDSVLNAGVLFKVTLPPIFLRVRMLPEVK